MGSVSQPAGWGGCCELITSPSPRPAPPPTINVNSGKGGARQRGGSETGWKRHQREGGGGEQFQALLTTGCKKPDGSGRRPSPGRAAGSPVLPLLAGLPGRRSSPAEAQLTRSGSRLTPFKHRPQTPAPSQGPCSNSGCPYPRSEPLGVEPAQPPLPTLLLSQASSSEGADSAVREADPEAGGWAG